MLYYPHAGTGTRPNTGGRRGRQFSLELASTDSDLPLNPNGGKQYIPAM